MPTVKWVDGIGIAPPNNPSNVTISSLANNLLFQIISEHTRYRENQSPSLLDLVLTSNLDWVLSTTFLPAIGASDHICIENTVLLNQIPNNKTKKTFIDYRSICKDLADCAWDEILSDDVELSWLNFKSILLETEAKYTKERWVERPKTLPYLPSQVKSGIHKKKKAWSRYTKCKCQSHYDEFKKCRNKLRNQTRKLVADFEDSVARDAKQNPKKFWRYVSSSNPNRRSIPPLVNSDGTTVRDSKGIANCLSNCFSTNFNHHSAPLPPPIMDNLPIEFEMPPILISMEDVQKRLKTLDTSKSKGPDGIHPRLLKETAACITYPLTKIFQTSMATKSVPLDWKSANIMPVFKKGQKNQAQNYRPISLTSVPSKVMEGILNDAIINHLDRNKLLYGGQHGFRKGRSVETNLVQSYDLVTKLIDEGLPVDLILLDQAKAFDKVVHAYLLYKLFRYHIHPDVVEWIESFLTGRTQRVMIYNDQGSQSFSDPSPVLSGVPQGTKLGPTLFSIYINDCPSVVQNTLTLFADDSKLFGPVANSNQKSELQADLDALSNWSSLWLLEFNAAKCKVLHLGPKNPQHTYTMLDGSKNHIELESVEEEKDLGVTIDNHLKFHPHTRHQVAKGNRALGLVKRTITTRKPVIIKKLYTALVRPHLEYGMIVASPHHKMDAKALEGVQRRATKMPPQFKNLEYHERLRALKLPSLSYRRKRGDVLMVKKLLDSNIIPGLFESSHSKSTRGHSKKLQPTSCKRRERHSFFSVRSVPLWNNLSEKTVNAATLDGFKKGVDEDWRNAECRLHWDASEPI